MMAVSTVHTLSRSPLYRDTASEQPQRRSAFQPLVPRLTFPPETLFSPRPLRWQTSSDYANYQPARDWGQSCRQLRGSPYGPGISSRSLSPGTLRSGILRHHRSSALQACRLVGSPWKTTLLLEFEVGALPPSSVLQASLLPLQTSQEAPLCSTRGGRQGATLLKEPPTASGRASVTPVCVDEPHDRATRVPQDDSATWTASGALPHNGRQSKKTSAYNRRALGIPEPWAHAAEGHPAAPANATDAEFPLLIGRWLQGLASLALCACLVLGSAVPSADAASSGGRMGGSAFSSPPSRLSPSPPSLGRAGGTRFQSKPFSPPPPPLRTTPSPFRSSPRPPPIRTPSSPFSKRPTQTPPRGPSPSAPSSRMPRGTPTPGKASSLLLYGPRLSSPTPRVQTPRIAVPVPPRTQILPPQKLRVFRSPPPLVVTPPYVPPLASPYSPFPYSPPFLVPPPLPFPFVPLPPLTFVIPFSPAPIVPPDVPSPHLPEIPTPSPEPPLSYSPVPQAPGKPPHPLLPEVQGRVGGVPGLEAPPSPASPLRTPPLNPIPQNPSPPLQPSEAPSGPAVPAEVCAPLPAPSVKGEPFQNEATSESRDSEGTGMVSLLEACAALLIGVFVAFGLDSAVRLKRLEGRQQTNDPRD